MLMTKKSKVSVSISERDYPSRFQNKKITQVVAFYADYLLVPGCNVWLEAFPRAPFGIIFVDDQKSLSKI